MSTSKALHLGGVGAAPRLDDVVKIAFGLQVMLDTAGAERVKKDSPAPKAFQPEPDGAVEAGEAPVLSECLPLTEARAAVAACLMTIMRGRSGVRLQVAEFLCQMLNKEILPALPCTFGAPVMAPLAGACKGLGVTSSGQPLAQKLEESSITVPGISSLERAVLSSTHPAAAGIGSIMVISSKKLLSAATAVSALSLESAGAQVGTPCCFGAQHPWDVKCWCPCVRG
jgi:hypothetical protein